MSQKVVQITEDKYNEMVSRLGKKSDKASAETKEEVKDFKKSTLSTAGRFFTSIGGAIIKGAGAVASIKGIRHPDSLIQRRDLYFDVQKRPQVNPLGKTFNTWEEMYFPGADSRYVNAVKVAKALESGVAPEDIPEYTGLNKTQLMGAYQYLRNRGYRLYG